MISNNNFWSRDKLGQNSNTTRADVTVVPYSEIMTLTSDEAKTHLFPEYPVRYYATLCSTSPTHDVNTVLPFSFNAWEQLFRQSSAVHFFSKMTSDLSVVNDPRYSAYAVLGPYYCPLAYYSCENFWNSHKWSLYKYILVLTKFWHWYNKFFSAFNCL